jgi:hypothetical protein
MIKDIPSFDLIPKVYLIYLILSIIHHVLLWNLAKKFVSNQEKFIFAFEPLFIIVILLLFLHFF